MWRNGILITCLKFWTWWSKFFQRVFFYSFLFTSSNKRGGSSFFRLPLYRPLFFQMPSVSTQRANKSASISYVPFQCWFLGWISSRSRLRHSVKSEEVTSSVLPGTQDKFWKPFKRVFERFLKKLRTNHNTEARYWNHFFQLCFSCWVLTLKMTTKYRNNKKFLRACWNPGKILKTL